MNIQKSVIKISIISCIIPIFLLGSYGYLITKNEVQKYEMEKIELMFDVQKPKLEWIYRRSKAVLDRLEFFILNSYGKGLEDENTKDMLLNLIIDIKKNKKDIKYLYYGDKNGAMYITDVEFIPDSYDPRERPWYIGAKQTKDEFFVTEVYEFPTGEKGITLSKKIYMDGEFIGVIGIDMGFVDYRGKISGITIGKTGKIFVVDKAGAIVVDAGKPGVNEKNLEYIKEYLNTDKLITVDINTPDGKKFFRLEPIPELGLIMVGGTEKDELKEVSFRVIGAGIIIILIGLMISLLIIRSFSKKLKIHLKKLSVLIEGVSNGNYTKNIEQVLMYISEDSELNIIKKEVKNIQKNVERREVALKEVARIDALTGVYNRKSLNTFLEDEIIKTKMFQSDFSIIMFDLDDFKNVNDVYGHVFGDLVLKETCKIFVEETSKKDKVCRYGGEEFIIILPETNRKEAFKVGERLRTKIENKEFIDAEIKINLTVSGGVTEYEDGLSILELVERVDGLLYGAKRSGKNKILY